MKFKINGTRKNYDCKFIRGAPSIVLPDAKDGGQGQDHGKRQNKVQPPTSVYSIKRKSYPKNDPLIQSITAMKFLPGANFGDEKDEEEDDAKAVEPPGHPPSNHSLFINDDRS